MRISVERFLTDGESTASLVLVDGQPVKVGDDGGIVVGLEDGHKDVKVAGETRIPEGIYKVGVHTTGRFHAKYSQNIFADIHKGMLHVLDVPNFEWILIHCGVHHGHTAGCLLVGADVITTHGDMRLVDSPAAYRALYLTVIDAALAGNLTIEYIDNDRRK